MPRNAEQSRESWQRLNEIFEVASELAAGEQSAFLQSACGADKKLRADAERLLTAAHKIKVNNFLAGDAFVVGTRAIAAAEPAGDVNGKRIGHYKLVSEIARGGMGVVYLAERDDFQHRVALKLIKSGMDSDEILRRFRQERDVLASLNHPNIARLLDGGTTEDGLPFLAMEYVEGEPINRYCVERNSGIGEILSLFRKVCSAVEYAHRNLTVHRDIKPSNILVTDDGDPKLLDFGIAKILANDNTTSDDTATGARLLTPEYASPEQIVGKNISTASDVYSLGVLLYELLTGRRPFELKGRNAIEIIEAVCRTEPPAPSSWRDPDFQTEPNTNENSAATESTGPRFTASQLRGDLDNIILTALRKDPNRRYSSVEQFSEDIRRYLVGLPILARPATFRYKAGKFVRRNRVSVAFAGFAVIALVGGTATATWQAVVAQNEKARAERRFNEVRQLANTLVGGWDQDLREDTISPEIRGRLADISSEYLEKLASESDDPELLRETAQAQIKLGHDYAYFLIDREKARQSFLKAERIARRLLADDPADNAARSLLVLSLSKFDEFFGTEDLAKSVENKFERIALRETLIIERPDDLTELRDLAMTHEHCGDDLKRLGRRSEAAEHFRKADEYYARRIVILESAESSTENSAKLASSLTYRASNLAVNLSRAREGIEYALRGVNVAGDAVSAAPEDRTTKIALINANSGLGVIAKKSGDFGTAIDAFKRTIQIVRSIGSETKDAYLKRKEVDALLDVSESLYLSGRTPEAIQTLDECFRIRREWMALDFNRDSITQFSSHAFLFELGGKLLGRMGKIDKAESAFDEAEKYVHKIMNDKRNPPTGGLRLASLMLGRGDVYSGLISCTSEIAASAAEDADCISQLLTTDRRRLLRAAEYYQRSAAVVETLPVNALATDSDVQIQRTANVRLAAVKSRL